MRAFAYFIPDRQAVIDPKGLRDVGLGYVLAGQYGPQCLRTETGPTGKPGLLVHPATAGGQVESPSPYNASTQTWLKSPDDKYWVGLIHAERPAPGDLVREKLIDGHLTTFADGSQWMVPVARGFGRASTLPKRMILGSDGKTWEMRELTQYLSLCADAEAILSHFYGPALDERPQDAPEADKDHTVSLTYQEGMRIMTAALATNYRLSALELSLLEPTTDDMGTVLEALVDLPFVKQLQESRAKKSQAATPANSPSSPGGAADPAATSPPSASSGS